MGIKKTASENALALTQRRTAGGMRSNETGVTRLVQLGLKQGTAQRMLEKTGDVRVQTLEVLARGLRIQPWQLLVPNLDPASLPELHPSFTVFSPELVATLRSTDAAQLRRIENAVRGMLDMESLPPAEGFQRSTGT